MKENKNITKQWLHNNGILETEIMAGSFPTKTQFF